MEHVDLSGAWRFGEKPFTAFWANNQSVYLRVMEIAPAPIYVVTKTVAGKTAILYNGPDKVEAKKAEAAYNAGKEAARSSSLANFEVRPPTLPKNAFRIIKARKSGIAMVIPGRDNTDRCLLFAGCDSGLHGKVQLFNNRTTGAILRTFMDGDERHSSIEVIALLDLGQSVAFYAHGRNTGEIYSYTWDGTKISRLRTPKG